MKKLTFVTQNQNKLADAQKLLPEFEIEHVDFDVPETQSLDPKEIIKQKLEYAYGKIQRPCFVMDASLSLDCLNGFPGPFIKWWFEKTVGRRRHALLRHFLANAASHGQTYSDILTGQIPII